MITNLYQYPELTRVEKNDVRYYQDSLSNLVPSVTTILSATGDHSGIDAWKTRLGHKTAKAVVDDATTIGNAVHLSIENYLMAKSGSNSQKIKWGCLPIKLLNVLFVTA